MLKGINRGLSPSDSVNTPEAVEKVVKGASGPRYGRPSDRFGPPTALFSKPLALLKHDLEHLEQFTPDKTILDRAFEFVATVTQFFEDEKQREKALRPIIKSLLPGDSKWQEQVADGAAIPDGVWLSNTFAYLIFELKNEPGLSGDPFLQGLIVYSKIVAQKAVCSPIPRTRPPFH